MVPVSTMSDIRQRYVDWDSHRRKLCADEEAGEPVDSDDWMYSDEDAVHILEAVAQRLGWSVPLRRETDLQEDP